MSKGTSRILRTIVVGALGAGAVLGFSSGAQAGEPNGCNNACGILVQAVNGHGDGVYGQPAAATGTPKVAADIPAAPSSSSRAVIWADCWYAGGNVGNYGDVWYRTWQVDYANGAIANVNPGWVFAPYFDNAAGFHNNIIPEC